MFTDNPAAFFKLLFSENFYSLFQKASSGVLRKAFSRFYLLLLVFLSSVWCWDVYHTPVASSIVLRLCLQMCVHALKCRQSYVQVAAKARCIFPPCQPYASCMPAAMLSNLLLRVRPTSIDHISIFIRMLGPKNSNHHRPYSSTTPPPPRRTPAAFFRCPPMPPHLPCFSEDGQLFSTRQTKLSTTTTSPPTRRPGSYRPHLLPLLLERTRPNPDSLRSRRRRTPRNPPPGLGSPRPKRVTPAAAEVAATVVAAAAAAVAAPRELRRGNGRSSSGGRHRRGRRREPVSGLTPPVLPPRRQQQRKDLAKRMLRRVVGRQRQRRSRETESWQRWMWWMRRPLRPKTGTRRRRRRA